MFHLSTLLFKSKLPIIILLLYMLPTSAGLHENFLCIVSYEAKGTFTTPKNDRRLVI